MTSLVKFKCFVGFVYSKMMSDAYILNFSKRFSHVITVSFKKLAQNSCLKKEYIGWKIQNQGYLILGFSGYLQKSYMIVTSSILIKEEISTKKEIKFWFLNIFFKFRYCKKGKYSERHIASLYFTIHNL